MPSESSGDAAKGLGLRPGQPFNPYMAFTGIFIPQGLVPWASISAGAKLVWGRLARYAGSDGHCYPTMKTLAAEIGVGQRQAQKYVSELVRNELIRRVSRFRAGGQTSNAFEFLWHTVFERRVNDFSGERVNDCSGEGVNDRSGEGVNDRSGEGVNDCSPKESQTEESQSEERVTQKARAGLPQTLRAIAPLVDRGTYKIDGKQGSGEQHRLPRAEQHLESWNKDTQAQDTGRLKEPNAGSSAITSATRRRQSRASRPSAPALRNWPMSGWEDLKDFEDWCTRLVCEHPNKNNNGAARTKALELVMARELDRAEFEAGYAALCAEAGDRWTEQRCRYAPNLWKLLDDRAWKYRHEARPPNPAYESIDYYVLQQARNGDETHAKRLQTQIQSRADEEQEKRSCWAQSAAPIEVPFDAKLSETAERIHQRHPAIRRCGLKEVIDKLRTIVKQFPPAESIEKLVHIDGVHAKWCQSEQWQKTGGEFAKGLDNYLAPTKGRWDVEPPEPTRQMSKSEKSLVEASAIFSSMNPGYPR
jgi:Helix-turn-helix domain